MTRHVKESPLRVKKNAKRASPDKTNEAIITAMISAAKHPDSHLHGYFEWNDAIAADNFARELCKAYQEK
jgi:hypothetical protein